MLLQVKYGDLEVDMGNSLTPTQAKIPLICLETVANY